MESIFIHLTATKPYATNCGLAWLKKIYIDTCEIIFIIFLNNMIHL